MGGLGDKEPPDSLVEVVILKPNDASLDEIAAGTNGKLDVGKEQ